MKHVILGGLSVLLLSTATAPVFASGKVIGASTSSLTSNSLAEVPSPSLQNLDRSLASEVK